RAKRVMRRRAAPDQRGEPRLDCLAARNRIERPARALVLGARPGLHFRIGIVLKPAIGIADRHAVIGVGHVDARRRHVLRDGRPRRPYGAGGQQLECRSASESAHGHSAGAMTRTRSFSTSWTSTAIAAVAITKPSAITAAVPSTRSKPPRP